MASRARQIRDQLQSLQHELDIGNEVFHGQIQAYTRRQQELQLVTLKEPAVDLRFVQNLITELDSYGLPVPDSVWRSRCLYPSDLDINRYLAVPEIRDHVDDQLLKPGYGPQLVARVQQLSLPELTVATSSTALRVLLQEICQTTSEFPCALLENTEAELWSLDVGSQLAMLYVLWYSQVKKNSTSGLTFEIAEDILPLLKVLEFGLPLYSKLQALQGIKQHQKAINTIFQKNRAFWSVRGFGSLVAQAALFLQLTTAEAAAMPGSTGVLAGLSGSAHGAVTTGLIRNSSAAQAQLALDVTSAAINALSSISIIQPLEHLHSAEFTVDGRTLDFAATDLVPAQYNATRPFFKSRASNVAAQDKKLRGKHTKGPRATSILQQPAHLATTLSWWQASNLQGATPEEVDVVTHIQDHRLFLEKLNQLPDADRVAAVQQLGDPIKLNEFVRNAVANIETQLALFVNPEVLALGEQHEDAQQSLENTYAVALYNTVLAIYELFPVTQLLQPQNLRVLQDPYRDLSKHMAAFVSSGQYSEELTEALQHLFQGYADGSVHADVTDTELVEVQTMLIDAILQPALRYLQSHGVHIDSQYGSFQEWPAEWQQSMLRDIAAGSTPVTWQQWYQQSFATCDPNNFPYMAPTVLLAAINDVSVNGVPENEPHNTLLDVGHSLLPNWSHDDIAELIEYTESHYPFWNNIATEMNHAILAGDDIKPIGEQLVHQLDNAASSFSQVEQPDSVAHKDDPKSMFLVGMGVLGMVMYVLNRMFPGQVDVDPANNTETPNKENTTASNNVRRNNQSGPKNNSVQATVMPFPAPVAGPSAAVVNRVNRTITSNNQNRNATINANSNAKDSYTTVVTANANGLRSSAMRRNQFDRNSRNQNKYVSDSNTPQVDNPPIDEITELVDMPVEEEKSSRRRAREKSSSKRKSNVKNEDNDIEPKRRKHHAREHHGADEATTRSRERSKRRRAANNTNTNKITAASKRRK